MQISHSADTMAQSYKCHCNFFFHFLILLPTRSGERQESFLIPNAETVDSTAVREVLCSGLVFVSSFTKKKKVHRLLDGRMFFHLHLG